MAVFADNFTFWQPLPVDIVLATSVYSVPNQSTQIKGYYYLDQVCTIVVLLLYRIIWEIIL
ncbi:hypothetical protein [Cylindrospermopsis curvispora]|uniref:hypothetical protein n=1 Tax=Cylindrospermopsis curvispora TaxID=747548 RepID=UPI001F2BCFE5|nr:hypothetical protein [Cylindrospermopsis curvispora]